MHLRTLRGVRRLFFFSVPSVRRDVVSNLAPSRPVRPALTACRRCCTSTRLALRVPGRTLISADRHWPPSPRLFAPVNSVVICTARAALEGTADGRAPSARPSVRPSHWSVPLIVGGRAGRIVPSRRRVVTSQPRRVTSSRRHRGASAARSPSMLAAPRSLGMDDATLGRAAGPRGSVLLPTELDMVRLRRRRRAAGDGRPAFLHRCRAADVDQGTRPIDVQAWLISAIICESRENTREASRAPPRRSRGERQLKARPSGGRRRRGRGQGSGVKGHNWSEKSSMTNCWGGRACRLGGTVLRRRKRWPRVTL